MRYTVDDSDILFTMHYVVCTMLYVLYTICYPTEYYILQIINYIRCTIFDILYTVYLYCTVQLLLYYIILPVWFGSSRLEVEV